MIYLNIPRVTLETVCQEPDFHLPKQVTFTSTFYWWEYS